MIQPRPSFLLATDLRPSFLPALHIKYFIFRKHIIPGGYDLSAYDSIKLLPVGIAGISACCFGVGGAVVGMAEIWYIGPVGGLFGEYGGDLGFELA